MFWCLDIISNANARAYEILTQTRILGKTLIHTFEKCIRRQKEHT